MNPRQHRPPICLGFPLLAVVLPLAGCRLDREGVIQERHFAAASPHRSAAPSLEPRSGAVPRFTDVTAAVGLRWRHSNGAQGEKRYPETMGGGGGFVDADGDGWLDLVLIDSVPPPGRSTVTLYLNRHAPDGRRRFVDATAGSGLESRFFGMGLTAGDLNDDSAPDLYVTALGPNRLFLNRGDGRFREVSRRAGVDDPRFGSSAAIFDADDDGDLDLFVCNYLLWDARAERPCYAGERVRIYCPPGVYPGEESLLYRNDGPGPTGVPRFRDVSARAGIRNPAGKSLGVAVCDLNGDGLLDLYVANDLEPNSAFLRLPDGRFEERAVELGLALSPAGRARAGMGVDARPAESTDASTAPRPLLLVGNFQTEGAALWAPAAAGFVERTDVAGLLKPTLDSLTFGCGLLDLNADGFLDVLLLNGHVEPEIVRYQPGQRYRQRPQLFLGGPDARFADAGAEAGPPFEREYAGRGLAWGDYDNDGDLDLLAIENNGPAHLWRNDGPSGHWLTIAVTGRYAVGALVTVRAAGRTWRQWVRTGSSYLTVSDPRPFFGLGAAAVADEVHVRWADGREWRRTALSADRFLTVRR